jgi:hypothetical protein
MKRIGSGMLLLAALAGGGTSGHCDVGRDPADAARACALAERLLAYQRDDGRLLLNLPSNKSVRLVPYFSNLAALGWTEAARVTTDTAQRRRFLASTEKWLGWYAAHMNPDGTIYDFEGPPDALKATGDFDSSDSYAATFALLAWRHREASADTALLQKLKPALRSAYGAVLLTMDGDGLTYAKPFYSEKYLMDNLEVAAGLAAFSRCFRELGETALASDALAHLARIKAGIPRYFRPEIGAFGYTMGTFGVVSGELKVPYPDVLAQLMVFSWASKGDDGAKQFLGRLRREFFDKNPDARGYGQWWVWPALVCGDAELFAAARAAYLKAMEKPDPYAHDLGLAAATVAGGISAIRLSELAMDWEELTTAAARMPRAAVTPAALDPAAMRLVLTGHKARGKITDGRRDWLMSPLKLPAAIDCELKEKDAYLQANVVFAEPLDLRGVQSFGVAFDVEAPAGAVDPGAPKPEVWMSIVEDDGDLWDARIDNAPQGADGAVKVGLADLTLNRWAQSGDHNRTLARVAGLRFQVNSTSPGALNFRVLLRDLTIGRRP